MRIKIISVWTDSVENVVLCFIVMIKDIGPLYFVPENVLSSGLKGIGLSSFKKPGRKIQRLGVEG
jgi:hypothetical protein